MSNNNPHGHISQPTQNPSWNHLQIPSYIPRQPQLAHMSNERPMVRSPSAWHAPAPPPDSLYNFMSANHKNLEHQMNSLLPRSLLPPFDSMDLSLQSSRSSSSPLNKIVGGHAPGMLSHEYGGHKHAATPQPPGPPPPHQHQQHSHQPQAHQHQQQQQQQQSQHHGPNSYPILAQQQQQQQQQQSQHTHHSQLSALQSSPATHGMQSGATPQSPASPAGSQGPGKYMNTNGNDCEGMLPPGGSNPGGSSSVGGNNNGASASSGTAGGGGGGPSPVHTYMREPNDAPSHMSESYGKVPHLARNYESELQSKGAGSKPVELVSKDCNYTSLISNKMQSHAQQHQQQSQVSPKKQSPIRNYHAQQQHQHHHQQQQHQQQPPAFNNPPQSAMKHNGPHTPPTPQSPVMHQQTGGPLHGMDYNQMHLQQQSQPQNAYPHPQQQQQHMSQHLPHPPPPHALHYPPHPHAHQLPHSLLPQQPTQHQQQATQLSQQNQQHHIPPQQQHLHPQMHQNQQQHQHQVSPRMHQQQQSLTAQQQQQQQNQSPPMHRTLNTHIQHTNSTNYTHLDDMAPAAAANASKAPTYNVHPAELKKSSPPADNTVIADLSPKPVNSGANNTYSNSGNSASKAACIPDSAESPSPEAISSHCESLDSNSNSSGGGGAGFRQRLHKRGGDTKSSGAEAVDFGSVLMPTQGNSPQPQYQQLSRNNIPRSPKSSPTEQVRRSPRKADIKSPASNFNKSPPSATVNLGTPHTQPEKMAIASTPSSPTSQTMENGRIPPTIGTASTPLDTMAETFADSEVETIDKISAMIASTANDSATHVDANSNSSIKSVGECDSGALSSGSPKTKKQRQALKLRNATEYNSNSNGSSNSYSVIGNTSASNRSMSMNDNAVAVDELRKELMQTDLQQLEAPNGDKSAAQTNEGEVATGNRMESQADARMRQPRPLSPQSNSHSSSSSSSTSSCSNSSHSSIGSKTTATTTHAESKTSGSQCPVIATTTTALEEDNKHKRQTSDERQAPPQTGDADPLNLNAHKSDTVTAAFEEVENKLEEMFAGIEDEPIIPETDDLASQPPANTTEVVRDLSLALELSNANLSAVTPSADAPQETNDPMSATAKDVSTPLHVRTEGPPPTKAAKKSTLPSPIRKTTTTDLQAAAAESAQTTDNKEGGKTSIVPAASTTAAGRRSGPPRRRLSVAMDPANLRILLDDDDADFAEPRPQRGKRTTSAKRNNNSSQNSSEQKKDGVICLDDDDDQPSTSAAAAAALAAKTAKEATTQAVGSSSTPNAKTTSKAAKGRKTQDTRKRPSRAADTGKNGAKKKMTAKQQQQQRRKQQQHSSDDDAPAAPSAATEQIKNKSPFILVKRDGSINVVNAPLNAEDVNEKNAAARQVKKPSGAAGYAHDRKNLRGLHSSTLSNKYDADTTDSTWICVFCKRGPHRLGLGDLFGPYLVTIDCEEYKTAVKAPDAIDMDAIFVSKRRRLDMVQTNPRNLPVVPAKNCTASTGATATATRTSGAVSIPITLRQQDFFSSDSLLQGKKKKNAQDTSAHGNLNTDATVTIDPLDCSTDETLQQNFLGMSKVSEKSYEVWLHEDCIVWAPGVYLVGVRVMGLDAAVWTSTTYHCVLCSKPGAIVCCLQRDCKAAAHVPCARAAGWSLNESTMNVHCQQHAVQPAIAPTTLSALALQQQQPAVLENS
ncbi:PREDICTED: uncharacterized protein CG5098 isoform X2 [Bactrocera latifrons]|uniref:uncharacterized protein CG5098 isoform X2 n=1 Tax=Bactrocera latifrons TaxID=174628 RepID=UPI0008DDB5B7|nr:PREDICTED: uncharacterized protein CG5098 isoform X2 [Bactrocera latifrons]